MLNSKSAMVKNNVNVPVNLIPVDMNHTPATKHAGAVKTEPPKPKIGYSISLISFANFAIISSTNMPGKSQY